MSFLTITQDVNSSGAPQTTPIGPLADLYKNKFQCENYVYPRDLGSSYRNHSVEFQFYSVKSSGLKEVLSNVGTVAGEVAAVAGATAVAGAVLGTVATTVTKSALTGAVVAGATLLGGAGVATYLGTQQLLNTDVVKGATSGETTGISLHNNSTDARGDLVKLYMPETLDFNYSANYSDLSLVEAAGNSMLTGAIPKAVTSVMNDDVTKLALNAAGYVFNPQQQLLFNGIDFRTYQMSFTFTPYSREEAESVKNIIKTFRKYAAPTVVKEAAGFFFTPPGVVDVTFRKSNGVNNNLHSLKRSVIESVEVNYAPNGWAAMEDGMPMQTTMTVSFKEIQLVDSKDIEGGY